MLHIVCFGDHPVHMSILSYRPLNNYCSASGNVNRIPNDIPVQLKNTQVPHYRHGKYQGIQIIEIRTLREPKKLGYFRSVRLQMIKENCSLLK